MYVQISISQQLILIPKTHGHIYIYDIHASQMQYTTMNTKISILFCAGYV